MKRIWICALAIGSLVLGISQVQAAELVIDEFNTIGTNLQIGFNPNQVDLLSATGWAIFLDDTNRPTAGITETGLGTTNTIGGQRITSATFSPKQGSGQTTIQVNTGSWTLDNGIGATTSPTITWNQGLSAQDLNGYDKFVVSLSNTSINTVFTLKVTKGGVSTSLPITSSSTQITNQILEFPISSFDSSVLLNPDSIDLSIKNDPMSGVSDFDAQIDYVKAVTNSTDVPEPSLILGMTAILGVEFLLKRFKD